MKQTEALEIMKSGANVFLTGEPGAGKSYTVNLFNAWCHEKHIYPAITASTGIAATHINGINEKALLMHPTVVAKDGLFRKLSGMEI